MNRSRPVANRSLPLPCPEAVTPPIPSPVPTRDAALEGRGQPSGWWLATRVTWRAARRYWWQILLLWGIGSAGLLALARDRVRPSYEATAWLRVEPPARSTSESHADAERYLQTQARLMSSPSVLTRTLADPRVRDLAWIRQAADSRDRLHAALRASVPAGTSLLLVAATGPSRDDATRILDAAVEAYLEMATTWEDHGLSKRQEQLRTLEERHRRDVEHYRAELETLAARTGGSDPKAPLRLDAERYRQYRVRQGALEIERLEAEAALEALREARPEPAKAVHNESARAETLEQAVARAFLADPEVAALHAELSQAMAALAVSERQTRDPHNAVLQLQQRRVEELRAENERLWGRKQPLLLARLGAPATASPDDVRVRDLRAAELRLAQARAAEEKLQAQTGTLREASQAEGSDVLRAQFLAGELEAAQELHRDVSQRLEQAPDAAPVATRLDRVGAPELSRATVPDPRLTFLTAGPLAMLAGLVGLFSLVEAKAARVAHPDDLTTRLQLGVLGIVPPLPDRRPARGTRAVRARRRLEEFVQSLDHLRVMLEATTGPGRRPCVLITSADVAEGKTTLAAQLAGRCANAGLSTLLIDADLRRPALGTLLQVPEGPGLAEVLNGEATLEEAIVVVNQAGGFHLLPAGGDGLDPSRLLQGEQLGQLLARLKDAFDTILIDVPPLLPVPDALLVGRWTDGAVLAVRHDTSRFPLVDRARERLAAVGIPVLGAVVNGVRPTAAPGYGAYGYERTEADTDAAD